MICSYLRKQLKAPLRPIVSANDSVTQSENLDKIQTRIKNKYNPKNKQEIYNTDKGK